MAGSALTPPMRTGLLFSTQYRRGLGRGHPRPGLEERCCSCGAPHEPAVGVVYSSRESRLYDPRALVTDLYYSRGLRWHPICSACIRKIPPEYRSREPEEVRS